MEFQSYFNSGIDYLGSLIDRLVRTNEVFGYALFEHHKNGRISFEHFPVGKQLNKIGKEIKLEGFLCSDRLDKPVKLEDMRAYGSIDEAVEAAKRIGRDRLPPAFFFHYKPGEDFYRTEIWELVIKKDKFGFINPKIRLSRPVAAIDSSLGVYNFNENGIPVLTENNIRKYEFDVEKRARFLGVE